MLPSHFIVQTAGKITLDPFLYAEPSPGVSLHFYLLACRLLDRRKPSARAASYKFGVNLGQNLQPQSPELQGKEDTGSGTTPGPMHVFFLLETQVPN